MRTRKKSMAVLGIIFMLLLLSGCADDGYPEGMEYHNSVYDGYVGTFAGWATKVENLFAENQRGEDVSSILPLRTGTLGEMRDYLEQEVSSAWYYFKDPSGDYALWAYGKIEDINKESVEQFLCNVNVNVSVGENGEIVDCGDPKCTIILSSNAYQSTAVSATVKEMTSEFVTVAVEFSLKPYLVPEEMAKEFNRQFLEMEIVLKP